MSLLPAREDASQGRKPKRGLKPLAIAAAVVSLLALVAVVGASSLIGYTAVSDKHARIPANRTMVLETTREWARLAPFPVPDSAIEIEIEGSAFTREFTVAFTAPAAEIERWMDASPGVHGLRPTSEPGGGSRFTITPGGGAQWAELVLSADGTRVTINTYWS